MNIFYDDIFDYGDFNEYYTIYYSNIALKKSYIIITNGYNNFEFNNITVEPFIICVVFISRHIKIKNKHKFFKEFKLDDICLRNHGAIRAWFNPKINILDMEVRYLKDIKENFGELLNIIKRDLGIIIQPEEFLYNMLRNKNNNFS